MFDMSFEKVVLLIFVALFVLGPERLPEVASWVGRGLRKVKDFAASASEDLQKDLGPALQAVRDPIHGLRSSLTDPDGDHPVPTVLGIYSLSGSASPVDRPTADSPERADTPAPAASPVLPPGTTANSAGSRADRATDATEVA